MHLSDHIPDVELNEYLDNESSERAQIEMHLAECMDCALRLSALESLFVELESLPDIELDASLAARLTPTPSLIPKLPRWLTLTAALQAALALIALIAAAPFVMNLLPAIETPSFTEIVLQMQSQWLTLLEPFTNYQLPAFSLPPLQIPTLTLSLVLAGASLLWLVGNGLLLRNHVHR